MTISGYFLLLYGIARSGVEFIRLPDAHIGYLFNTDCCVGCPALTRSLSGDDFPDGQRDHWASLKNLFEGTVKETSSIAKNVMLLAWVQKYTSVYKKTSSTPIIHKWSFDWYSQSRIFLYSVLIGWCLFQAKPAQLDCCHSFICLIWWRIIITFRFFAILSIRQGIIH